MSRAKWKGPFINTKNLEQLNLIKNKNQEVLKKNIPISRDSEIIPSFIGLTFNVYNGKIYSEVTVNEHMVGHKFGEFSFTRAKFFFKKKKLKK
jgi:small subunit ribosomal protein S19